MRLLWVKSTKFGQLEIRTAHFSEERERKKERCKRVARHWDSPLALCPSPHPQII